MRRDLHHLASLALNAPLMIEPAYARVFFSAFGSELGAGRIIDTVTEEVLTPAGMSETISSFLEQGAERATRNYEVSGRIAIIPVSGTLVSKASSLRPYSGMTGYNGITARLQQAVSDPDVDGILLDLDTPGGMVAGAFDCADMIARLREIKPVWALSNDMSCSAGQLLASACSRRLVTQTARTGSIGVLMAHSNYSEAMKKEGIDITLIYSGTHKVDGNPYGSLPSDVRNDLQLKIDTTRQLFAEKVSSYTGLSVQAVLDTEATVYSGAEALSVGLADEVVVNSDAVQVMRDAMARKNKTINGGIMSLDNTSASPGASVSDVSSEAPFTPGAQATGEDLQAAVSAERARITGILHCDEAKGRESQALALASTGGMSVADAQRIMAASPISVQARSETALDKLMEGTEAVSGAVVKASDLDDLMNTPV